MVKEKRNYLSQKFYGKKYSELSSRGKSVVNNNLVYVKTNYSKEDKRAYYHARSIDATLTSGQRLYALKRYKNLTK